MGKGGSGMNVNLQTIYLPDIVLFNESITADTDILSTDITIGNDITVENQFNFTKGFTVIVDVAFEAVGNFYFVITRLSDNTTTIVKTNGGFDSSYESAGYTFEIALLDGYSLNMRYSASTTLNWGSITVHGGRI